MPKVKLLQDVKEGGYVKQSRRREPTFKAQLLPNGSVVNAPMRAGAAPALWAAGTVIEMSETSAKKYVERGLGEIVDAPKETADDGRG